MTSRSALRLTQLCLFPLVGLLASGCVITNKKNSAPATQAPTQVAVEDENSKAKAMFEDYFEASLARSPEFQTALGRSTNMDKWDNISDAYAQETHAFTQAQLAKLNTLDPAKLDESTRMSYTLLKQKLENQISDHQWRLYNYPVNQMFGTHSNVPSLLINQHRISNLQQAQDYISRLNNVKLLFVQLIEGLKARAQAGIIPPKFVFPHVIRDSRNVISGAPFSKGAPSALAADFARKLDELQAKDPKAITPAQKQALLDQANLALLNSVMPAYESLILYLTELEKTAPTDDGVWRWNRGADYYNLALERTTTTKLSADEIHQIGLAEVARIHGEMREIMKKTGFKGDLPAFMKFMREDPQFYYPNTEAGKKTYLDKAKATINDMRGKLDKMFITKPKAEMIVKAVEPFREQSAGKAFYESPAQDGSRPGIYYANLYDMASMPSYQLEALAFHEGIPGHHMQLSIAQELESIPTFRKFSHYTAYSEGWGLYSEKFPREFGFYSDPYSDFGRLAMELWRACRLVVDTGIHAKKWTREQGIAYYVANTPNAKADAVKMVERHIVMPSQATAYKIGMNKILELRAQSKEKLGDKFDIREFHEEVLRHGAVPLNVLEDMIDAWVASKAVAADSAGATSSPRPNG